MDWIIAALGILLFIGPFVMGFSANAAAMWTCIILGVVVAVAAGYKAVAKDNATWEDMVAGLAGMLAVVSPFILGFSSNATAMWTSIIVGAGVAVLAVCNYLRSNVTTETAQIIILKE